MTENTKKIAIVSLGYPKNLADMESVLAGLKNVAVVSEKEAEIVFLNTCGFLKAARDEVYENLRKLKNKKVILLGCLAGSFTKEDLKKYKQIASVVTSVNYKNIQNIQNIFDKVLKGEKIYAAKKEPEIFERTIGKSLLTPRSYAYVKIAEGCDSRCSYCLIPYLKGKFRSRREEDILNEIKDLVAQDCGCYGKDLYGTNSFANLLQKIEKIPGEFCEKNRF